MYGNPVNFAGSFTNLPGSSDAVFTGLDALSSSANYRPPEQYTACTVSIAETAMEFNPEVGGIDMMCMDSTQLVMQWLFNTPENVLSAYI